MAYICIFYILAGLHQYGQCGKMSKWIVWKYA